MPKTESNTAVYTAPAAFRAQLDNVYAAYLALQSSLSKDDFGNVKPNAQNLIEALGLTDMKLLTDENAHKAWMSDSESLSQTAWQISVTPDLESARTAFRALSEGVITTAKQFGTPGKMTLYIFHCPMALNKTGADWVQGEKTTKNPYFGKTMLACGKVTETIAAEGVK